MKAASKFRGLARRLKNAGLRVSQSDRSETLYLRIGAVDLRLSAHSLGVADYGTRQQKHRGPEVVLGDDYQPSPDAAPAEIFTACLAAARTWVRDSAGYWSSGERSRAAAAMCGLRRLERKTGK